MYRIRIVLIATLLTVVFVFGTLGYWVVGRVKNEAQVFSHVTLERLTRIGEINSYQAEGYVRVLLFLNAKTPEKKAALRTAAEEFRHKNDALLRDYEATLTANSSRRRIQEF